MGNNCLLYTSDAADERSSVDLGGRRIIKKKNNIRMSWRREHIDRVTAQYTLNYRDRVMVVIRHTHIVIV